MRWKKFLNYLAGPNVTSGVPVRGERERQSKKDDGNGEEAVEKEDGRERGRRERGRRETGRREEQRRGGGVAWGERGIELKMLYAVLLASTTQAASRSWEKQENRFPSSAFTRTTVPPTP